MNADGAFRKFFNGKAKFPRFKKKKKQTVKAYFPKNNKTDWTIERHRVKIPTLGWVRLKEYGYVPLNAKVYSGTVSQQADRYYVSILVEEENDINNSSYSEGIGIDLGLKEFAIISNGTTYKNINKTAKVKKLEKKLIREQCSLSRKYESLKKQKNKKEGEATRQNIQKQVLKVQKIYRRLYNIRTDYINKIVAEIVKTKPEYVTIEDLNVSGMIKNKHLSKAIASQKFSEFRTKLISKCKNNDIEVRLVDRFYPSSKLCNKCGKIKKDLKLSDRVYKCECGYIEDRDLNASFNLRDAKTYRVAQ